MERLARAPAWKWYVCGILLLATMLNYMDRQTLSVTITDISRELHLTNEHYGNLEYGFGLAFAVGGLVTGLIVDFVNVRWLYPVVFAGWSLAGFAAAYAEPIGELLTPPSMRDSLPPGYVGLLVCRITLGFFEAGHWPCALVTSQRLLSPQDRPLGNSLLQSGAAIGAILTPLVVQTMVSDVPGTWRAPFQVIGVLGLVWIVPWLSVVRASDVARLHSTGNVSHVPSRGAADQMTFWRRLAVLMLTVVVINLCFQFFRAWLPKFLREFHGYDRMAVNYFTSAYFVATDVGCLSVGLAVKRLTVVGWPVHRARVITFALCAALTALSTVASGLPRGPLLLVLLLVIGFGALGLFPNYYSLTQELSIRHQGIVTGVLGFTTWTCTASMQKFVGQRIDQTGSYADGIFVVGLLPLIACAALLLFWNWPKGLFANRPQEEAPSNR
jgi:ACS family hexuronate transporter-like MFS transporter